MISIFPYDEIFSNYENLPTEITLEDHLGGFDKSLDNYVLEHICNVATKQNQRIQVNYHQILEPSVKSKYKNLYIRFQLSQHAQKSLWQCFEHYRQHPYLDYKNFLCSFNGTAHVSRKLLVAALKKFNYFDPNYCSKNFSISSDVLAGHIFDYTGDDFNFFSKFFAIKNEEFLKSIISFKHVQYDHGNNIYNLEAKLTKSFIHVVSESMASSYVPFVTEKFLYSVVTRGLFLAYAQPNWHAHLENYYGFKKYNKLFDYTFDTIINPVERLVELSCMISKFSRLSPEEWTDLYLLEQDTIEYNYDHYFSKDYLKCLAKYE